MGESVGDQGAEALLLTLGVGVCDAEQEAVGERDGLRGREGEAERVQL